MIAFIEGLVMIVITLSIYLVVAILIISNIRFKSTLIFN